jgi:hypothetical protein
MILQLEDPRLHQKTFTPNKFSKVSGYKINTQNFESVAFYTPITNPLRKKSGTQPHLK